MFNSLSAGIRIPGQKFAAKKPIEALPPPKTVYLHFSQHYGKPAIPLVKKNGLVRVGTMIGAADGLGSAPVHASIAGKVAEIVTHPHPILGSSLCCRIEATGHDEWEQGTNQEQDYAKLSPAELLNQISDAGIVGLGGGGFPSHAKLKVGQEKSIDHLIINGCESEPMLTNNHRLMLEYPVPIIEGAKIFQKILNAKNLMVAITEDKKGTAQSFLNQGLKIRVLKTKYPQGAERLLIRTLLGREIPRDRLPQDVGCIVFNVGTCYAVFQAIKFRRPLVERHITVAGDGTTEPKNLLVRIGTPAIDIIKFCGGYAGKPSQLILGGPMTGVAQFSEQVPIIKSTLGIIVRSQSKIEEEKPCVRCGHCVDICPIRLVPVEICRYIKQNDFVQAKQYGVLDCIECGSCAYTCPAKIPLVHYFKYGKFELNQHARI